MDMMCLQFAANKDDVVVNEYDRYRKSLVGGGTKNCFLYSLKTEPFIFVLPKIH